MTVELLMRCQILWLFAPNLVLDGMMPRYVAGIWRCECGEWKGEGRKEGEGKGEKMLQYLAQGSTCAWRTIIRLGEYKLQQAKNPFLYPQGRVAYCQR